MLIANQKGDARAPIEKLPIPLLDQLTTDTALAAAYEQLIKEAVKAAATQDHGKSKDKKVTESPPVTTPLDMTDAQAALLRGQLKTHNVWVVRAGGAQVSFSKSFGVAMLTGVLTAGLTGGAAVGWSAPVDGTGYDVALVDLDTKTIVWKKRLPVRRGDPADTDFYDIKWAQEMFEPFLLPAKSK